ncbi:lipase family protein [Antrihabitans sp. YC2-6]|uniref:lipase family protein n=1 Tax=Antrihabitans sp. YC2-6 TaxID=2799498 RepID=UPI0018F3F4F3|nr:lipase family protein [Antrihabitans sp. YC2-6]MBJ8344173.1 lipase [Antrihabitans sp. YC2-6]
MNNAAKRIATALLCALALVACGTSEDSTPPATSAGPPAPLGAERGAVVDQQQTSTESDGSRRTVVRYRSTSGVDGSGTEVSGTVFVPAGSAPAGGWPVVTVGHGTTGVDDDCAPSTSPDLLGNDRLVTPLLERGYVVVMSDLAGLGTPGPHPYLEPKSAAYNMIDAVRAARLIAGDASARWVALGASQGGQASWAAAEYAGQYGDGLDFLGSANLSPAVDLSAVIEEDGAADLKVPQQVFLPALIAGLQVLHPELNPDDYMHGTLAAEKDTLLACTGPKADNKLAVALRLKPEDSRPVDAAAAERMHAWLTDIALPKQQAAGPMLVVVGENDPVILADWTIGAVARACDLGDVIALNERPNDGHATSASIPEAVAWIADRFAGLPAPDTCAGASR